VTGSGVEAVAALGVPAGDAVFVFGDAVVMDFLGALDGPVFEDAVAAGAGVALFGGGVGAAGLEGFGDDAGVGAEGVCGAEGSGWPSSPAMPAARTKPMPGMLVRRA